MMEYTIEFDTINDGWFEAWYASNEFEEIIEWVKDELREHGGGHADIYDEEGDFVEDVEV